MTENTVYIVVLNWNGWRDTVACLDSLQGLQRCNYRVVVCDNGSTDGSLGQLVDWAHGNQQAELPQHPRLARLLSRPTRVGTAYQRFSRTQVESGMATAATEPLVIIDNAANLGFAAGNNVGIRYALAQADMSHVWLLNNDTLVEPHSLRAMLDRLQQAARPAICGSRLMFTDDPAVVQAIGGNSYNPWTGNASQSLGRYCREGEQLPAVEYEQQLDYLCGASTLLTRQFLDQVGLMEESYFLYYEEVDWMTRAAGSFDMLVAEDAVVYHKEGSSIGSQSLHSRPSRLSEFYMFRNKLRFTLRYFPWCFPSCYLNTWLQVLNRLRRGEVSSAWLICQVLLGRSTCP